MITKINKYRHVLPQYFLLRNLFQILLVHFNGTATKTRYIKTQNNHYKIWSDKIYKSRLNNQIL